MNSKFIGRLRKVLAFAAGLCLILLAVSCSKPVGTSENNSSQSSASQSSESESESLEAAMTQVNHPPKSGDFPEYEEFFSIATPGPVIPGLDQGVVPQGLAYWPEKDWIITSGYRTSEAGIISIIDASTGEHVKSLGVYNADGTKFEGHAGGIAISKKNAWISCSSALYRIPLEDIENTADRNRIKIAEVIPTVTKGSFVFIDDNTLWSGEFWSSEGDLDKTHYMDVGGGVTNHGWLAAYPLDENDEIVADAPTKIISLPDEVQGAWRLLENKHFVLSMSYGRKNDSTISSYKDVLSEPEDTTVEVNGKKVPVWYLHDEDLVRKITAVSMTEGIVQKESGYMYLMTESGAIIYRNGKYPQCTIYKVDTNGF